MSAHPYSPLSERHATAADFLKAEHRVIDEGFSLYFLERSEARWGDMLARTLTDLKVHLELEEELFYSLCFPATQDDAHYHESLVEHELVKKLIDDIEHSDPADYQCEAMVKILWKITARHFVEEESSDGSLAFQGSVPLAFIEQLERRREELFEGISAIRRGSKNSPLNRLPPRF